MGGFIKDGVFASEGFVWGKTSKKSDFYLPVMPREVVNVVWVVC